MDYNLNNFTSDLFPLLFGNEKMKNFLSKDIDLEDDTVQQLAQLFIEFHTISEKQLVQIFEDLPSIPMHNSYDTTQTYGLPLMDKHLQDIENKSEAYKVNTWHQAETVLRKYYQDSLRNEHIPETFRGVVKMQLENFSTLLEKLNTADKLQL